MNDLYDEEDFEEVEQPQNSQSHQGKSSFQKGLDAGKNADFDKIKEGIKDVKSGDFNGISKISDGANINPVSNVKQGIDKVKQGVDKVKDVTNKAGKTGASAVKKGADAVEKGAKVADKTAQVTKDAARTTKNAAAGVSAGSDVANLMGAAADATVVGAPAGAAINTVATTVKGGSEIVKNIAAGTEAGATFAQGGVKGIQAGAQGIKGAAGASEQAFNAGNIAQKAEEKLGKDAKNALNALDNAKNRANDIKNKIEQTSKDAKDIIKPFTATANLIKKLPKIIIAASIICVFLYLTFLYNNKLSSIIETTNQFNKYATDTENFFKGLSSSMYSGLKGESNNNKKFYEELKKWYDKSNGQLDLPLVFSALYYPDIKNSDIKSDYSENDIEDNTNTTNNTNDADNKDIDDIEDKDANKYNKGKIKRLRELCKNMLDSNGNPVSTEEYKEFLKKYIKKKKEFKKFLSDTSGDQKDAMVDSIISEIYQFRSWYVGVYGEYGLAAADSENYSDNCQGAIDKTLVGDLKVPVDSKSGSFTFNNNNSYGMKNGEVHNGVDLDSSSAGISNGDSVYSIHDGVVESIGVDENVETAGATDATEESSNDDVSKYCKNACSKNGSAKNNSTALDSCNKTCISSCKSKDNVKSCAKDFEAKSIETDDSDELGGTWIKIKHTDIVVSGTKYTFYSVYRNLDTNSVTLKQGDTVKKSDVIGKVGTTNSGVSQLHFEFRNDKDQAIDPTNLFVKCVSNGQLVGSTNEEMVWNHFTGAGYSKATTAAAMGNIMSESGFYPDRVQGDIPRSDYSVNYTAKVNSGAITEHDFVYNGPGGGGYGLAQWTSSDRKQILYDRTKKSGLNIDDLKTQLDYEEEELRGSGWNGNDSLKAQWESATEATLKAAALAYCNGFERAASEYCNSVRENNAQTIYDKYKNYVTPKITAGSGGTVNSSDNSESGGYPNGTFTSSIGNKTYKQFEQWTGDYAEKSYWNGTMHDSGCGPTSIAILVSGLINPNISPYDVATRMNNDWGFTGPEPMKDIMTKYGLSPRSIDNPSSNDITDALSRGEVMIVHVNNNTQFTSGNSGHYITIVDYNAQGEVYIIDPGSYVDAWFSLSEVMKGCTLMLSTPATGSVQ